MSKLIMWNLMTLDGMFEGPQPWDLSFHEYAWSDGLERYSMEQEREVAGLIFGRRTYEGMAGHWSSAKGETADFMNAVPKYVFSRTLDRVDWSNSTLMKEDVGDGVARLKEGPGKDLFVFGSADLSVTLMRQGLIDEFRIGLVPVTLGKGNPLFKPDSGPLKLKLLESRPIGDRCHLLRYQPGSAA